MLILWFNNINKTYKKLEKSKGFIKGQNKLGNMKMANPSLFVNWYSPQELCKIGRIENPS